MTDQSNDASRARPITVAIVDDHPVLRDGIASLLAREDDMEVVALGASVADADSILATDVDVVLLDVRLGTQSGLTALQRSTDRRPAVVVLTAYGYPQYAEAALRLGASGFVLKNGPIDDLLSAIRAAASGGLQFGVRPAQRLALSERELDVVKKVVEGLSNDEIAVDLGISPKTVESHMRRIFERVGVVSRTELATRALREGWLDLPGSTEVVER
ncbi:MAG TPA: response regulator transcription factor [Candidatus Limnocylindrales bacterium]|nr:response regulator transcription factor [Candidatus Limnocylindrales bacterium]